MPPTTYLPRMTCARALGAISALACFFLPWGARGAVRYDVVGAPTEVINTGRSEVTGSINLIVRGTGNVTGSSTGGAAQIGMTYLNPAMQIDNDSASGIKLFFSPGFLLASPALVSIANADINGRCSGLITINLQAGASLVEGDFLRVEGVRGRIDASNAITPGTDLFIELQSVNDPTANSFTPDRIRVAKSLDGLRTSLSADGFGFNILVSEGFARAFADSDAGNDGVNANDRTDSGGAALGSPTNSTQIVLLMEGIPDGVSGISWPAASTAFSTGAALYLQTSAFSGSTATATYSYECPNQVGISDLIAESFVLAPSFVFSAGKCNTDDLTASVALGPVVTSISTCTMPSVGASRPRFLEVYELIILSISPSSIAKGGPDFALTVRGTGFVSTSLLRWNGADRDTTVIRSTLLTARIHSQDIASPGTAQVTIFNQTLGGVTSNAATFTIEVPALTLLFPRLAPRDRSPTGADDSAFTGFALANPSGRIAKLVLSAFDELGSLITGPDITNPVPVTLNAGQQIAVIDRQVWGAGIARASPKGWARVESNVGEVVGYLLAFNETLSHLDGADPQNSTAVSFVFPEIDAQGFNQLQVANPGADTATVTFELISSDGSPKGTPAVRAVNSNGVMAESLSDLFPTLTPLPEDYVRVRSSSGIAALEYFGRSGRYAAALNGQNVAAGGNVLYAPQYAVGGPDWESAVSIINLADVPGTVSLRFISDEGTQIGTTRILPMSAKGKTLITDPRFFADTGDRLLQGYLEITSSGIKIAGSVFFGDPGRRFTGSALPLISGLHARLFLGHLASDAVYFMGIAILNASDASANILIEVYDRNGILLASKVEGFSPRSRKSQLITQYFPALVGRDFAGGYVKMTLSVGNGLASFALFGTHARSVLAAVPAQPIP